MASHLLRRYCHQNGSQRGSVEFGSILSGCKQVRRARTRGGSIVDTSGEQHHSGKVSFCGDDAVFENDVLGTMALDILNGTMPSFSMYNNRACNGSLAQVDIDMRSTVKYTDRQMLELAMCCVDAYKHMTPEAWWNQASRASDPLFMIAFPRKNTPEYKHTCPHCGSAGARGIFNFAPGSETHLVCDNCGEQFEEKDINCTSVWKMGIHMHGIQRRREDGSFDSENSAMVFSVEEHLIMKDIAVSLWNERFREDPARLPKYTETSEDDIDHNIWGSSGSTWQGCIRPIGAPKTIKCICECAELKIRECVQCGSSKRVGSSYKWLDLNRAYKVKYIITAGGDILPVETAYHRFDLKIVNGGENFEPNQVVTVDFFQPSIGNSKDVGVKVLEVDEIGAIKRLSWVTRPYQLEKEADPTGRKLLYPIKPVTESTCVGQISNGKFTAVVNDNRFAKTLRLLQLTNNRIPSGTPNTAAAVPKDFHYVKDSSGKYKDPRFKDDVTDEMRQLACDKARGLLAPTQKQFSRRLVLQIRGLSNHPVKDSDSHGVTEKQKEVIEDNFFRLYGKNGYARSPYTSKTRLVYKQTTSAMPREFRSADRKRQASNFLPGTDRTYWVEIKGAGARYCINANLCWHGKLRPGRRSEVPSEFSSTPVCTECTVHDFGVHRSNTQYLNIRFDGRARQAMMTLYCRSRKKTTGHLGKCCSVRDEDDRITRKWKLQCETCESSGSRRPQKPKATNIYSTFPLPTVDSAVLYPEWSNYEKNKEAVAKKKRIHEKKMNRDRKKAPAGGADYLLNMLNGV